MPTLDPLTLVSLASGLGGGGSRQQNSQSTSVSTAVNPSIFVQTGSAGSPAIGTGGDSSGAADSSPSQTGDPSASPYVPMPGGSNGVDEPSQGQGGGGAGGLSGLLGDPLILAGIAGVGLLYVMSDGKGG